MTSTGQASACLSNENMHHLLYAYSCQGPDTLAAFRFICTINSKNCWERNEQKLVKVLIHLSISIRFAGFWF